MILASRNCYRVSAATPIGTLRPIARAWLSKSSKAWRCFWFCASGRIWKEVRSPAISTLSEKPILRRSPIAPRSNSTQIRDRKHLKSQSRAMATPRLAPTQFLGDRPNFTECSALYDRPFCQSPRCGRSAEGFVSVYSRGCVWSCVRSGLINKYKSRRVH